MIGSGRFTRHVLSTQTGNTVPHISAGQIAAYSFAIPSLDEQERIVSILDKFDALVNDLASVSRLSLTLAASSTSTTATGC